MIKFNTIATAVCFMLLLLACSFFAGRCSRHEKSYEKSVADTVTIVRTDTVLLESVPSTVIQKEIRVVHVPLYKQVHDTVVDSVLVSLPFEQHYARLDSVADVWFSGYEARIDSARVYDRTVTQIIMRPFEVCRMPRLTAGVGVLAIYDESVVKPFLVGELRYNRKKTSFSAFGAVSHDGRWAAGVNLMYRFTVVK